MLAAENRVFNELSFDSDMDETLNFSHVFGTEPLFEMISDSGLSCKTKDKSDTRAPHKINSYLDGEEQRSVYWYQYNTSSDRDSPSPSSYHLLLLDTKEEEQV